METEVTTTMDPADAKASYGLCQFNSVARDGTKGAHVPAR